MNKAVRDSVLRLVGEDWVDFGVIMKASGLPYAKARGAVLRLVADGLVAEETSGGRVMRIESKRKTGPIDRRPPGGPPPSPVAFDLTPDLLAYLDDQYEPVTTKQIVWGVYIPLEQLEPMLRDLKESGRILELEEGLWVSA